MLAAAGAARRALLALAAAAPVLASGVLLLYLTQVEVAGDHKLVLWRRLLQLLLCAVLVYLVDIALDRGPTAGRKLLWAAALPAAWPLAMPLYLLARVPRPGAGAGRAAGVAVASVSARPEREAERLRSAIDLLGARGLPRPQIAPPFYRLAWRFGWPLPPPLFQTPFEIVRVQGLSIAILLVVVLWLGLLGSGLVLELRGVVVAATYLVILPLLGSTVGLAIALTRALHCRQRRRQLGLPRWQELG